MEDKVSAFKGQMTSEVTCDCWRYTTPTLRHRQAVVAMSVSHSCRVHTV